MTGCSAEAHHDPFTQRRAGSGQGCQPQVMRSSCSLMTRSTSVDSSSKISVPWEPSGYITHKTYASSSWPSWRPTNSVGEAGAFENYNITGFIGWPVCPSPSDSRTSDATVSQTVSIGPIPTAAELAAQEAAAALVKWPVGVASRFYVVSFLRLPPFVVLPSGPWPFAASHIQRASRMVSASTFSYRLLRKRLHQVIQQYEARQQTAGQDVQKHVCRGSSFAQGRIAGGSNDATRKRWVIS